jgi:hypothetical protein
MITLDEIVYQIDGKLDLKSNPDNSSKVTLLDNINEPAIVRIISDCKEVEASAEGRTPAEAKFNLVKLLRGNILKHDWPVMWTSSTAMLRIPDSLVVDCKMDFVHHD